MDSADSDTGIMAPASSGGGVLRRLIAGRGGQRPAAINGRFAPAPAGPVSLERAAGTALARAAERVHRLPVFVDKAVELAISLPELTEILPERALLAVVEGPQEQLGVVAISAELLASLIEMQALGRVTSRPAVPRRATRTDAAISEDFVNGLLAELQHELRDHTGLPGFGGYRYVSYLDDPRPLGLMLEDGAMAGLSLGPRLGAGGQRTGSILVAMPAPPALPKPAPAPHLLSAPATGPVPVPAAEGEATLAAIVDHAPISLTGILCRRTLSLRTLRNLAPGSVIPLPQSALDEARIETATGQLVARGKLGEADGFHAIRLSGRAVGGSHGGAAERGGPRAEGLVDGPDPFRTYLPADAPSQARG